jgi:D-alanyl-D-alanine carboxypeptidase/D-alanyl-D-alanine-endopeptidase (penicillin-binding protein 4)
LGIAAIGAVMGPMPASAQEPLPANDLPTLFRDWSANPSLAGALVGFCVLDDTGQPLFASPLAATALCPASALKTVTTGAALGMLGPAFRFESVLASAAPLNPGGILAGDLVLVGGGDPTLSSADLQRMADQIIRAGLKQVNGVVRSDGSVFPGPPVSDHWNWGDIGNAYGAGAYGVNIDHNRLSIRFKAGTAVGDPAEFLGGGPVAAGTRWDHRVTTGAAGSGDQVMVYSEPMGRVIRVRGTVPAGEVSFTVSGAIPDPPALAAEMLGSFLERGGVKILKQAGPAEDRSIPLVVHRSLALPKIIDHLHRVSDNVEAQCLFLTLGAYLNRDPGEVVRAYWENSGVSFTGLRMIDGSGLARANMIRPLDLARINHAARRGSHGERFRQSLTSYLDGKVRSKLGAMSGVRTEVGFLTLEDGREVTFALMANGLDLKVDFWPLRERLLRDVASKLARQ